MRTLLLFSLFANLVWGKLHVDAAYPYIAEITKTIAGDKADVTALSKGNWDPHFVVPKPSLIASLRQSDLIIINGASLEIGWIPPLLKNSGNAKIQPNAEGYLDLSHYIKLQDIPTHVDRSMGDVHAEGNPHYALDPHNLIKIAQVITLKLSSLDSANGEFYKSNFARFKSKWEGKIRGYDSHMRGCKNTTVVQYHELYNYLLKHYGLVSVANLEPVAGVAPTPKHTLEVINTIKEKNVKYILQDVYHSNKTAQYIAQKSGAKILTLPHDVGAMGGTSTLDGFYDKLIGTLCR